MSEIRRMRGQLRATFAGPAWHGPALAETVAGISSDEAAQRPAPDVHTILEIVLHAAAWKHEVVRRLDGVGAELPAALDWPAPAGEPEVAWPAAVAELRAAHEALQQRMGALEDAALDEAVTMPEAATDVSVYAMLHGVIQHDVYHAGQIALLRKWLRSTAAIVLLALAAAAPLRAQSAPQAAKASPDTIEFRSGGLMLRGLVWSPPGPGPHPAVLFLHGSGQDYTREVAAVGPRYAAGGWLLFVPFRRGQGLSAGRGEAIVAVMDREGEARGAAARMKLMTELLATEQMDDVLAALAWLKRRPDVDSQRIAVAGNSFGGILAVFSAARAPGIRAVIASAPAALTWANAPELRDSLRAAVRRARVPVFFLQAQNDRDLTPTAELEAEALRAGREVVRRIYPAFGVTDTEGHSFGYFGGEVWGPDVLAFLEAHARPAQRRD